MSIEQPITMGFVFDGVIGYLKGQGHPYATYKPYKTALYVERCTIFGGSFNHYI